MENKKQTLYLGTDICFSAMISWRKRGENILKSLDEELIDMTGKERLAFVYYEGFRAGAIKYWK